MKCKAKKSIVIWSEVWDDFDAWYENAQRRCKSCDRLSDSPEWDEQMAKIEEIVEKRLNRPSKLFSQK